jgi:hypothetical protein
VQPAQRVIVMEELTSAPEVAVPVTAPSFLMDAGPPPPVSAAPTPYTFHSSSAHAHTASGLRAPPLAS